FAQRVFRSIEAQRVGPYGAIGPRFTIASRGVAAGWRQALALAGNGTTCVAAWPEESNDGAKIAVSMVHAQGRTERLPVAISASHQERPRIVRADDHYLVIWAEDRSSHGRLAILARRFHLDTSPIDRNPILLADSITSFQGPVVSSDGRSSLIAWSRDGWIQARRLTSEGALGPLFSIGRSSHPPSVAATGDGFGSLYSEESLLMQYLTRDGVPVSPEPALVLRGRKDMVPSIRSLSTACGVEECALVWYEFLEGVGAARARDGSVIPVSEPFHELGEYRAPPSDRFGPSVVLNNEGFLVTASNEGRVYARSIVSGTFAQESVLWLANEKVLDLSIARGVGNTVAVAYQRSDAAAGGAQRVFLRLVPVE